MGTILVSDVLDRASALLYDETQVHWPEAELTDWLNDAQREVVVLKPDANVTNEVIELVEGTKQSLPDAGIVFQRLVRNMGTDGNTPGRAIRRTDMGALDSSHPNWHADTPEAEVTHYMYSDNDPRHFYVWKPNTGQGQVEIVYSATPTDAPTPTDDPNGTITLDDIYQPVLLDLILWRALSKQSDEGAMNPQLASSYYSRAATILGRKEVGEQTAEPRRRGRSEQ